MSFSAHADAKGIMQLISHCCPANVMLVHGEAVKMEFLKVRKKYYRFNFYTKDQFLSKFQQGQPLWTTLG
jgi:integrator complex subunit 11